MILVNFDDLTDFSSYMGKRIASDNIGRANYIYIMFERSIILIVYKEG